MNSFTIIFFFSSFLAFLKFFFLRFRFSSFFFLGDRGRVLEVEQPARVRQFYFGVAVAWWLARMATAYTMCFLITVEKRLLRELLLKFVHFKQIITP